MGPIYYFWGPPDGYALAKKLAQADREQSKKSLTQDASVINDQDELAEAECIVLLPSVHPYHAARLRARYEQMGTKVITQTAEIVEEAEKRADKTRAALSANLRRLPTSQIRDYAREHGIDVTNARDRTEMISAILAGQQESVPT